MIFVLKKKMEVKIFIKNKELEHKHDELEPTIYEDHATVMLTSRVRSLH